MRVGISELRVSHICELKNMILLENKGFLFFFWHQKDWPNVFENDTDTWQVQSA